MSPALAARPTWRQRISEAISPRASGPVAVDTSPRVLTFSGMATPHVPTADKLPLALSQELWEGLTPNQRELFQRADHLLDAFTFEPRATQSLEDLVEKSGDDEDEVLSALQLLDTMALVNVESSDEGPVFSLRATPEEHVRIQGPDNKPRWVFIARPVEPREIDPSLLN